MPTLFIGASVASLCFFLQIGDHLVMFHFLGICERGFTVLVAREEIEPEIRKKSIKVEV